MDNSKDNSMVIEDANFTEASGSTFRRNLRKYFTDFCNKTRIHGFQYLAEPNRHWAERLWWWFHIIVYFCICLYLIIQTVVRWENSRKIVTVVDPFTPIWTIPFPAVTICPENKIKQTVYNFTEKLHENYDDEMTMSDEEEQLLAKSSLICHNHLYPGGKNATTVDRSVVQHLQKIAPKFEDIFVSCRWTSLLENCSTLFVPLMTTDGFCFTFNMLNTQEVYSDLIDLPTAPSSQKSEGWTLEEGYPNRGKVDTYPRRGISSGGPGGLSLLLKTSKDDLDYICRGAVQGFKLHFHHPSELPQMSNYFHIPLDKEVTFSVKAEMVKTDESLRSYSLQERKCYFSDERQLKFFQSYTYGKCQVECLANYTLTKCGCVGFQLPHDNSTKICESGNVACTYTARNEMMKSEIDDKILGGQSKCNCLPACTTLNYNSEISQNLYNWQKVFESFKTNYSKDTVNSRVFIHFKDNQMTTLQRNELRNIGEILAISGGLFALFTGFSLMCLVEIIYFLTLRLLYNIRRFGMENWSGSGYVKL